MANIGMPELLVVGLIALIVLGPERLPQVAEKAAKLLRQFRAMSSKAMGELRAMPEFDDLRTVRKDVLALRSDTQNLGKNLGRELLQPTKPSRKSVEAAGAQSLPDSADPTEPTAEPGVAPATKE